MNKTTGLVGLVGLVMAGVTHHLVWTLIGRLAFAGYVGLMLACAGGMDDTPRAEDRAPMPAVIDHGQLKAKPDSVQPFSQADYDRWGLAGSWAWQVAEKDLPMHFSVSGGELLATGAYGSFRGGEHQGILVLKEEYDGPGPSTTTWVNLAPGRPGELVAGVQLCGGDESPPSGMSVRRVHP